MFGFWFKSLAESKTILKKLWWSECKVHKIARIIFFRSQATKSFSISSLLSYRKLKFEFSIIIVFSFVAASKRILEVRYYILPYFYTLFYDSHVHGRTVVRSLMAEYVTLEFYVILFF